MCPDREILSAYFDGEIDPPWDRAVAEHLDGCERCRAVIESLEETSRRLQADPVMNLRGPMERVRRGIVSGVRPVPVFLSVPAWRRRVAVPLPLAAFAALALLVLGVGFAVNLSRSGMGYIRVTRAPAGGTEYQFAVPYDKVESLLKSVGGAAANIEDVMTLPKDVKLVPVGQPRMGVVAEYPRKKQ